MPSAICLPLTSNLATGCPSTTLGYGFDNIAAVLSTSPALLERYMSAASKISRLAIGDPTLKPGEEIYDAKFDAVKGSTERAAQRGPALRFPGRHVGEALFSGRRRIQHQPALRCGSLVPGERSRRTADCRSVRRQEVRAGGTAHARCSGPTLGREAGNRGASRPTRSGRQRRRRGGAIRS